jgi:hypothetical protein
MIDPNAIGAEGRDLKTSFQNNQKITLFMKILNFTFLT